MNAQDGHEEESQGNNVATFWCEPFDSIVNDNEW